MNSYEEKQERRRERLEARADRLAAEGRARIESGMDRLRAIPFGQPILVGHHSEKRDRNYRRKAGASIDKGMELQKAAADAQHRADSVGKGGVSSDDPEAVQKLQEKVEGLEKLQVKMAAANKLVRKQDRPGLVAMGFTEVQVESLFTPDFCGRLGFPSFELTNNSANIRRLKQRIKSLQRNASRETKETDVGGVRLVENAEANRVQLFFPGKPSDEVRSMLKQYGFRWSPTEGAWQRQLTSSGVNSAKWVLEKLKP